MQLPGNITFSPRFRAGPVKPHLPPHPFLPLMHSFLRLLCSWKTASVELRLISKMPAQELEEGGLPE